MTSTSIGHSTICAISTPYGCGGIAIVRVCGNNAISIVDTIFKGRKLLTTAQPYTIQYGEIVKSHTDQDGKTHHEILDQVLVSIFRAPHSFTGEDTIEIACHGSIYIQQTLLQWLVEKGCQLAKPGEFTQRAFLNGKLDLTEAEAVADLIAAQTKAEKDLALTQLRGGISNQLAQLRDRLLTFTSLIELELDFADHEELEFANRDQLYQLANEIYTTIHKLVQSFQTGNAIKHGIPVAIIGAPNVGKSTLLNALIGEDRAIVSDIQGTTRDTIEDTLIINGILFRFIDTAGMRQTDDTIENLGIQRSIKAAERATIIIHLQDASQPINILKDLHELQDKHIIHVFNKADLITAQQHTEKAIYISAKSGEVNELICQLSLFAAEKTNTNNSVTISNTRHYEALIRAQEAILRVQQGLDQQISGEFLSMDLQDCLNALGEITGQISSQEVLNNIFSKFCIGK